MTDFLFLESITVHCVYCWPVEDSEDEFGSGRRFSILSYKRPSELARPTDETFLKIVQMISYEAVVKRGYRNITPEILRRKMAIA